MKAVIKKRGPNKHPKNAWLNKEIENIKKPGHYIVMAPEDMPISKAQSLLCGRLCAQFGAGNYSTTQIVGMNAIRVIIK